MSVFEYRDNDLYVEDCSLDAIATQYGTPCYVYSRSAITAAWFEYSQALGDAGTICYAVKANANLAILQILAKLGAGFDIVSQGELERVLRAGGSPEKIIFSGVGKTQSELAFALDTGIACFNVESEAELESLAKLAASKGKIAPVSLRVNPDVDAETHPYISTGMKENKFGIDMQTALHAYQRAHALPSIELIGIDCHIGSQLVSIAPFMDALERVLVLIDLLAGKGIHIQHLDLGGGIGVRYKDETPPDIRQYIEAVLGRLKGRGLRLVLEPGRSIVANAGALLTEVIYLKPTPDRNFAIVDAAMNDNIRPALYQAWQDIKLLKQNRETPRPWDIAGPVCESADFFARDRQLSLQNHSRLALMSSGAYGFVMSSNYNSRPRCAEILVDGDKTTLIRKRETFADLIHGEHLLEL